MRFDCSLDKNLIGIFSDTLLCPGIIGNPAYGGSGHVVYIEILSVVDTKGWEKFCIDVAKEWMALDGVPHLAKQWDFIPGVEDHINKVRKKTSVYNTFYHYFYRGIDFKM